MNKVQKIRDYLVEIAVASYCDAKTKRVIKENILPFIDSLQDFDALDQLLAKYATDFSYKGKTLKECSDTYKAEIIATANHLEPVSEDLEEAAEEWDAKASFTPFYMTLNENGNPNGVRQDYTTHAKSFKAGAKWQKEQMMAKAIDGYVIEDIEEGDGDFLLSTDYLPKSMDLKDQQRVKVIVIKEG